jgi:hypothetical protein
MAKKSSRPGADGGDAAAAVSVAAGVAECVPADGRRCMITLSPRAIHLLDTAVLVDGIDRSAVVEALIVAHLSEYFSGKNGASSALRAE